MATSFNKIGIIGKFKTSGLYKTFCNLIQHLINANVSIYIDTDTAQEIQDITQEIQSILHIVPYKELGNTCDLVIVIGGDGSMLHAARTLVHAQVPVLGVNRGKVGFLADIAPQKLAVIEQVLAGQFTVEQRFLLEVSIINKHTLSKTEFTNNYALNEVTLIPDKIPHIMEFAVYVNDSLVANHRSDGLIIATPTGSTAYSLAAGGPVIYPEIDAIVIVPMFSQSLNVRPIVISAEHQVKIVLTKNNINGRLTCDGQVYVDISPNSIIQINKHQKNLTLIHPLDYDYFATLRNKLHWGKNLVAHNKDTK